MTITVEFLRTVLDQVENDWSRIDAEWGPTNGGLEAAIARGQEPVIAEMRRLIAATTSAPASSDSVRTLDTCDAE